MLLSDMRASYIYITQIMHTVYTTNQMNTYRDKYTPVPVHTI